MTVLLTNRAVIQPITRSLGVNSVTAKMIGDDLNQCLHVYCHGLVAIHLHQTKALYPFFFITLTFEIYWTCYDGNNVY